MAVEAYLFALFRYFELLAASSNVSPLNHEVSDWSINFTLRWESDDFPASQATSKPLCPLEVLDRSDPSYSATEETLLGLPGGASVISANKSIGFGRTASQEEMVVGATPELLPATLLMPILRDEEILVVEGAQAMISMKGYGRSAQLDQYLVQDIGDGSASSEGTWRYRTVLLMDALELDSYDSNTIVPDLLPGNIRRELRKAYTAFSSHRTDEQAFDVVVTGLWGCGSFGGNAEIKSVIQWLAASLAGTPLRFICAGEDQRGFAAKLRTFARNAQEREWTVDQVLEETLRLRPTHVAARSVLHHLLDPARDSTSK